MGMANCTHGSGSGGVTSGWIVGRQKEMEFALTTELYKRHRPKSLERVVGNADTVVTLKNMIERKTVPHTLLFHGPRGCGKTSLARIVADELGCMEMDFKEVNSSSYRGIDTIREIQRLMQLNPVSGPCRVWILDECHQISKDGQNAMLKMTEDTPSCVYFFLCTTEPDSLIGPLRSRCFSMPVSLLTDQEQMIILERVMRKEQIVLSDTTKAEVVKWAMGSARDLLVLLETVAALPEEMRAAAIEKKIVELNEAIDLCRALIKKEPWVKIAKILSNLKGDPESTRYAVLGYARTVLLKGGDYQAYIVIDCFKDHFFNSKAAGLAHAAFTAVSHK
jgi:DNA polymerase III gamma/tau subunit